MVAQQLGQREMLPACNLLAAVDDQLCKHLQHVPARTPNEAARMGCLAWMVGAGAGYFTVTVNALSFQWRSDAPPGVNVPTFTVYVPFAALKGTDHTGLNVWAIPALKLRLS
jgi:hypothetical protein